MIENIISKYIKSEFWHGPKNKTYTLITPQVGRATVTFESDYSEVLVFTFRPNENKEVYEPKYTKEFEGPNHTEEAKKYAEKALLYHMDLITR